MRPTVVHRIKAHGRLLLCVALANSGCWTTRTVPREQLAPLMKGETEHVVAAAFGPRKIRIDPNAVLRFSNRSGQVSYPQTGRQLRVNDDGVFMRQHLSITAAKRARVLGIIPAVAEKLAITRPEGARVTSVNDGEWLLVAKGPVLDRWLREYVDAVARLSAPVEPNRWCLLDLGIGKLKRVIPDAQHTAKCRRGVNGEWAIAYLRHELHGAPVGTWTFEFSPGHWSSRFEGNGVLDALEGGALMDVGWPWHEIDTVEVTTLSGIKTLAAILGYSITIAGRVITGFSVSGPDIDMSPTRWTPRLLGNGKTVPMPMFSSTSRRRSAVQAYAAVSTLAAGAQPIEANHALCADIGVRFANSVELGLGASRVAAQGAVGGNAYSLRIGGHLALDADHKFAIPVSVDFGTGSGVPGLARLNLGVRTQVHDRSYVGLRLSPTALSLDTPSGEVQQQLWLAYGLELGFTF